MSLINILNKFKHNKEQFKEIQKDDKFRNLIEQRKKSANERELEKFMERDRQEMIKKRLHYYREREKADMRKMTVLNGKNIFAGHKSVLTNNNKLFAMKGNMLTGGGLAKSLNRS